MFVLLYYFEEAYLNAMPVSCDYNYFFNFFCPIFKGYRYKKVA